MNGGGSTEANRACGDAGDRTPALSAPALSDRLLNRRSEATGDAGVCGFAGIYTRDSSQETAAAETAAVETAVTETASEAPHVLARWLCCRIAG